MDSVWDSVPVSEYLRHHFDLAWSAGRDGFDRESVVADLVRRKVVPPRPQLDIRLLADERAQAARLAFPSLVEEIKRLVSEGKIPATAGGRAFAEGFIANLKVPSGEPARAAARAKADVQIFFQRIELPVLTQATLDPYSEPAALDVLLPILRRDILERDLREKVAAATQQNPCALLFLDVDHFKRVNDEEGHQVGDRVLVEIASRIRDGVGGKGRCYRFGGEELVVLLENYSKPEAVALAERLRAAVADVPVAGRTRTVSIGVAVAPEHGAAPEALVAAADQAMYSAKNDGRNKIWLFDPTGSAEATTLAPSAVAPTSDPSGPKHPRSSSESDPLARSLSAHARDLLLEAVKDKQGIVMRFEMMAGLAIKTNERNFLAEGDTARSEAQWDGAFGQLLELRLLDDLGKGTIFKVTHKGYEVADRLADIPPSAVQN